MPDRPNGKVALITGCSSGIGRATAERLVAAGWSVYATARRVSSMEELARLGCKTLALDVTNEQSMRAAVAAVEKEAQRIDALINNAGYSQSGAIETVPMDRIRQQFETNVFGLLRMTQLVLPGMRARSSGRIVNLSSMGGRLTFPGGGIYHATKHSVEAICDALRYEVKGFGVDVICVEPGLIRTAFGETVVSNMDAASRREGPYADFNAAVARATTEVYHKGPLAKLGAGPEAVAKVIERAITVRRPKPRYTVTASASVLLTQRKLLSDRLWDAFLATQFPRPGRA
jgi:NADP-dependent 3-hydroxy acid dehydrogenase YdfG